MVDRSGSEWLVVANGEGVDIGGPRVVVGGRDLAGVSESGVGCQLLIYGIRGEAREMMGRGGGGMLRGGVNGGRRWGEEIVGGLTAEVAGGVDVVPEELLEVLGFWDGGQGRWVSGKGGVRLDGSVGRVGEGWGDRLWGWMVGGVFGQIWDMGMFLKRSIAWEQSKEIVPQCEGEINLGHAYQGTLPRPYDPIT